MMDSGLMVTVVDKVGQLNEAMKMGGKEGGR